MGTAIRRLAAIFPILFLFAASLYAQQENRISGRIDRAQRAVLRGNINPMARPEFDRGAVDPSFRAQGMTLLLKQSAAQQTALQQLLAEQQDPASPNYHKWLTPQQYAERFGISQTDVDKINAWLQSEGFNVDDVANGRNWVGFSGTAGQVRNSFRTELHRYNVNGEMHVANAAEPSIPAALQDIVAGIRGLNDFHPKAPASRLRKSFPENTTGGGTHHLVPDDLATIYNIAPLYNAGVDGTGQRIVVVGQTSIKLPDIQTFRSRYKLPANDPEIHLVPNRPDPGLSQNDLPEAELDIEWSGGIAPNATIVYVYSNDAFEAARYAINHNLGQVITMSYGMCELMDLVDLPVFQSWAQQANAQGMTWLSASGDAGAGDCEDPNNSVVQTGMAVDIPSAIPEITSVGGTEFNENGGAFWSSTNNANGGSALSYIPEVAWNDTSSINGLASGGGGVSTFFPKPAWQTGLGVPNDGFRDVPDVSFAASPAHDAFAVYTDGSIQYYGGTSIAAPTFAGIIALLNQYLVSTGAESQPGVGNINPALYRLAQNTSGIFHDIISGTNIVPCAASSPNCSGGSFGYRAGPGYDQATGLGSVDASNFVHQWSSRPPINSAVVASIDRSPVYQQAPDHNGFQWSFNITLNEEAGIATKLTGFTADGMDYTSQIASLFGASAIPARGSISATLGFKTLAAPKTVVFVFSGVDTSGRQWSQQLSVPFAQKQVIEAIGGIANAASGQQVYAPGMILAVYGLEMSSSTQAATAIPLPTFLAGAFAMVNGTPAPLYYVSPTQLNVQIPYETSPGTATLEVDTPYQSASYTFQVAPSGPGIFMFADGSINPSKSGARGQIYTLFITGEGQVSPSLATGTTPSSRTPTNRLPKPVLPYKLTIGGVDAPIQFIGIPSGLVGVTQINFTVPAGVALGAQPVVVTVGGVDSAPAKFTVTQ